VALCSPDNFRNNIINPQQMLESIGVPMNQSTKIVIWEQDGGWLGYLQDYPDYWSQGDSLDDLKDHLKDLYDDLTSGQIPGIRKVEELVIS
jgi:hypothetical protein